MLALICFITTLLLAATNELTAPAIAKQEQEALNQQMQEIFPEGDRFDPVELSAEQSKALSAKDADVDSVFMAKAPDGKTIGYIFLSSANGYAGKVNASIGIDVDAKIVLAAFTAPDETPGLGKRIEEDNFSSLFSGLSAGVPAAVGSSDGAQSIDAVSGATISSKGAVTAFNKACRAFLYLSAEGSLS
jgi:electron transport complex protein RnfG